MDTLTKLDVAHRAKHFIDGQWVAPRSDKRRQLINPATEEPAGIIAVGTVEEIDDAVRAARTAFPAWADLPREERIALFERAIQSMQHRHEELALAITTEMGAPLALSNGVQAMAGAWHMGVALELLKSYSFEESLGTTLVV